MHIEDDLLLGRARRGDRVAFAQMATRWWPPVFRLALNMLANASQASAATEETVFALLESQASSDVPIRTLVYRLALQFSLLRRRWIPPALEPSVPIREALQRLDDLDRAALLLRDVEMLPVEEVASILDFAEGRPDSGAPRPPAPDGVDGRPCARQSRRSRTPRRWSTGPLQRFQVAVKAFLSRDGRLLLVREAYGD